jgi:hypothetical protein
MSSLNGNSARTLVLKGLQQQAQHDIQQKGATEEELPYRGRCDRLGTNMKKLMCGQTVSYSRGSKGRNTTEMSRHCDVTRKSP